MVLSSPSLSFGVLTHFCKGLATVAGSTQGWTKEPEPLTFRCPGVGHGEGLGALERFPAELQMCTWDAAGIREDAVLVLGSRDCHKSWQTVRCHEQHNTVTLP